MKIIYSGLESSGKSLKLAMVVVELAYRNSKWKKISGKVRPIYSNLKFSQSFEDHVVKDLGIPVYYWENIDDLVRIEQADVIIDEVGNYFDSRLWQDLSLDVRRWLTQGAKSGIEVYGSAQDFAQVDKSFRRLVNELWEIKKFLGSPRPSPTRPPVKRIWGVCFVKQLRPESYKEDNKQPVSETFGIPRLMFIQRRYCEIFDTTQKIKRSQYPSLRHEVRRCEHHLHSGGDGSCDFCKIVHI